MNLSPLVFIFFILLFILVLWIIKKIKNSKTICCVYAYYEKDDFYRENLEYFLKHVVLRKPKNIIFYLVVNGTCSIPRFPDNIKVIYRENKGYDFGGFSHCVSKYLPSQSKCYDYYMFLNSSIRGPFPKHIDWQREFLSLFISDDIKLVGTSINILPTGGKPLTHVQSMFFILEKEAFFYLRDEKHFFNEEDPILQEKDQSKIIYEKEIGLSQMILDKNWNLNCILPRYKNLDYRKLTENINTSGTDPYFHNAYFGNTIQPEDVIFFKTNRYPVENLT